MWRYNELYKIYGDDNKSTTTPLSWSSIQHIDNARIFRSHGEMLLNVRNSKARQLEANVKGNQGAKRD